MKVIPIAVAKPVCHRNTSRIVHVTCEILMLDIKYNN